MLLLCTIKFFEDSIEVLLKIISTNKEKVIDKMLKTRRKYFTP